MLANLPPQAGAIRLWLPGDDQRTPAAVLPSVLPDTPDLVLEAAAEANGAIAVRTALPDGVQGRVSLRLWNEESGAGTNIPPAQRSYGQPRATGADLPRKVDHLVAGWYRIEAFHPACGWVDGGRHWVDGKDSTDAGTIALPPPGTVRFHVDPALLPADGRAFEVCRIRTDADVRQAIATIPLDEELTLPAGDYVFAWRSKDGPIRFTRFTVKSGGATTVTPVP